MEVILLERVARLGGLGEVVRVRDGYARNFLIPKKKALRASEENKKVFEERRHLIEEQNAEARAEAEARLAQLKEVKIELTRQASQEGKLYGSVSVRDIAEALERLGHPVPKSQIVVSGTIKNTGEYPVRVALHPDVVASLTVEVKRAEVEIAGE